MSCFMKTEATSKKCPCSLQKNKRFGISWLLNSLRGIYKMMKIWHYFGCLAKDLPKCFASPILLLKRLQSPSRMSGIASSRTFSTPFERRVNTFYPQMLYWNRRLVVSNQRPTLRELGPCSFLRTSSKARTRSCARSGAGTTRLLRPRSPNESWWDPPLQ